MLIQWRSRLSLSAAVNVNFEIGQQLVDLNLTS